MKWCVLHGKAILSLIVGILCVDRRKLELQGRMAALNIHKLPDSAYRLVEAVVFGGALLTWHVLTF